MEQTSLNEASLPWQQNSLSEWAIVGMNHYFLHGQKHLFVAMIKGEKCIKAEGTNEEKVFEELAQKAQQN